MRPIGKGSTEQHPDGACLGKDFQTLATEIDKDFQHLLSCGTARLSGGTRCYAVLSSQPFVIFVSLKNPGSFFFFLSFFHSFRVCKFVLFFLL